MTRTICHVVMTQAQLDEFFRRVRDRQDAAERCELFMLKRSRVKLTIADAVRSALNGHPMTSREILNSARKVFPEVTRKQVNNSISHLKDIGQMAVAGMKDKRAALWVKSAAALGVPFLLSAFVL